MDRRRIGIEAETLARDFLVGRGLRNLHGAVKAIGRRGKRPGQSAANTMLPPQLLHCLLMNDLTATEDHHAVAGFFDFAQGDQALAQTENTLERRSQLEVFLKKLEEGLDGER